ncbi:MAG: hypothetical protein QF793_03275 [Candidatus Peribacteraceae bacterium]|jgi:hypothetical protein|nr:hypothetical protein [Candidatus Peribacteraceae bacterium]
MTKYWFKPKRYGYGFYPVSWEGWVATLALLVVVLLSACINHVIVEPGPTRAETIRFVLDVLIISGLASLFFEKKMQDPLKWRWGKRK